MVVKCQLRFPAQCPLNARLGQLTIWYRRCLQKKKNIATVQHRIPVAKSIESYHIKWFRLSIPPVFDRTTVFYISIYLFYLKRDHSAGSDPMSRKTEALFSSQQGQVLLRTQNRPNPLCGPSSLQFNVYRGLFPVSKAAMTWMPDHSITPSDKVKNNWTYISTPHIRLHGLHMDKFMITFMWSSLRFRLTYINMHSTAANKFCFFLPAVEDKERVSLTCTAVGTTGAKSFLPSNYICIASRQAHICLILATMRIAPT
jgi:hypothetical protein